MAARYERRGCWVRAVTSATESDRDRDRGPRQPMLTDEAIRQLLAEVPTSTWWTVGRSLRRLCLPRPARRLLARRPVCGHLARSDGEADDYTTRNVRCVTPAPSITRVLSSSIGPLLRWS